jgi:ABC-type multidrug transport system fused ATPase/permease subunit
VLVLDEAVSNVDLESETALDQAMRTVRRGRTTLVIAHRRSTIQSADLVVLLDHGHVVDGGHDAELSLRDPTYRRLLGLTDEKGPISPT